MVISSVFRLPGTDFDLDNDIPLLHGKTILVTGGNSGLGKQSIIELAKRRPERIWLAARNAQKAHTVVAEIAGSMPVETSISLLPLDLASLTSVRTAAKQLLACETRLDLMILNAGIMAHPAGLSQDGYEIHFATNHLGHALLVKLLLPILLATQRSYPESDVRIVSVSSFGHRLPPAGGIKFETLKSTADDLCPLMRYNQSKLANVMYVRALARRYPQLKVVSVHPALSVTNLGGAIMDQIPLPNELLQSVLPILLPDAREGVKNQLWACVSPRAQSGEYYEPVGVEGRIGSEALDEGLVNKLWQWTEFELRHYRIDAPW